MSEKKEPTISTTKPNNDKVTDAPVDTLRTVTYIFNTSATTSSLSIPYAVVIDGIIQDEFKNSPKHLFRKKREILVTAKAGSKVSLYLNSDAHPSYRKNPVYEVSVGERSVEVKITEKKGKHSDADTPVYKSTDEKKNVDKYDAPLTGDIWMKVSHKYTSSEVEDLLPDSTSAEVAKAVKSIYEGLTQKSVIITTAPTDGTSGMSVAVTFNDAENPKDNIVTFDLLSDGLPRVHPGGFGALFNAAITAGVTKLTMSSNWRPLRGSIAHRAGLGLDVNFVGDTRMNRSELTDNRGIDTPNVSEEEKKLFSAMKSAMQEEQKAKAASKKAETNYKKVKKDPEKSSAAEQEMKDAKDAAAKAEKERADAEKAWNDERDKNEPASVKAFRDALLKSNRVRQLFDPWYVDSNTTDKQQEIPNMQQSDDEKSHNNHLHITVREPKIL